MSSRKEGNMNKKRTVSISYRLLVITSLLSGIILNFVNTTSIKYLLSYYTTQSNVICLMIFIVFLIKDIKKYDSQKSNWYYILKGMVTIAILITAIIYLTTLLPNKLPMYTISARGMTSKKLGNILVHIISPILVLLDYIVFDEKGNFKLFYPLIWLLIPVGYICFVYSGKGHFYGIGGSRTFGYFFLDYQKIGIQMTTIWIVGIAVGIIILGYFLVWIDKKLVRKH